MKYPLFLSDFDGTLVRADGTISERNKAAISAYRAAGGVFAVCTGRGPASILPRMKELGLSEGLAVAYQGATIADVATGKLLKDDGFLSDDAVKATRLLEEGGRHVHVYTTDAFYSNMADEALGIYERIVGLRANVVTGMPLSEYIARHGLHIVKALAMVEKKDRMPLAEWLAPRLGSGFYVTCSADFLVESCPRGRTRGRQSNF